MNKSSKINKANVISVGNKSLPCRMTLGAMRRFKRQTGYDVSQLKTDDLDGLIVFVWCCVVSACKADGVDFDMDVDDFADHLEPDAIQGFYDGINASSAEKKMKAAQTPT